MEGEVIDYNAIPVFYCKKCLSLVIVIESELDMDFCKNCGSTDIGQATLEEYDKLYEERFGEKYFYKDK